MDNLFEIILKMIKATVLPFVVSVLFITLVGFYFEDSLIGISNLYVQGGISYNALLSLFSISVMIGMINTLFDSSKFMKETLFLYKNILRIIIITLFLIIYIYLFKWFPLNNIEAWLSFFITYGISVVTSFAISFYILKKKDKEYQKLLEDYKKKM